MTKRTMYLAIVAVALSGPVSAQGGSIFPKGEKAPNVHHAGDVWLNDVSHADDDFDYNIVLATFAPEAKLAWHMHPAGQQLLITLGVGYYQERGKDVQVVRKGDVIKSAPGVEHWHAAAPDSEFAYLAVTGNQPTKWFEPVTDDDYGSVDSPDVADDSEQEIVELSRNKWHWMADKNLDELAALFHTDSVFVHMGGTWGKQRELEVIQSGDIHYKNAEIHDVSVNVMGDTAILLNRITLLAVVAGNEVTNPFEVTEVYVRDSDSWKLASLSFTRLIAETTAE